MNSTFMLCQKVTNLLSKAFKIVEDKKEYLHKGIGARNFTRTFALTEDVKVVGADFDDGMLYISLEKVVPEERNPKKSW